MNAYISYLLFLGLWLLLAGFVALGARWLGGASRGGRDGAPASVDPDEPRVGHGPGSPLIAWAGTAVALTALWLLWAQGDRDSVSVVILLVVIAVLLLHVARRGALADRDSP